MPFIYSCNTVVNPQITPRNPFPTTVSPSTDTTKFMHVLAVSNGDTLYNGVINQTTTHYYSVCDCGGQRVVSTKYLPTALTVNDTIGGEPSKMVIAINTGTIDAVFDPDINPAGHTIQIPNISIPIGADEGSFFFQLKTRGTVFSHRAGILVLNDYADMGLVNNTVNYYVSQNANGFMPTTQTVDRQGTFRRYRVTYTGRLWMYTPQTVRNNIPDIPVQVWITQNVLFPTSF